MDTNNTDEKSYAAEVPVRNIAKRFMSNAAAALAMASSSLQDALANDEGDRRFMLIDPKAPPRSKPVKQKVHYHADWRDDWKHTHGFSGAKLWRKAREGTVGLARLK